MWGRLNDERTKICRSEQPTLINLFAAYGLCQLWRARVIGKAAAVVLTVSVTLGGFIEWFRIHNDTIVDVPFRQNRLSDWLQANTTPKDVFLSDRFILHPILLNGRRIANYALDSGSVDLCAIPFAAID